MEVVDKGCEDVMLLAVLDAAVEEEVGRSVFFERSFNEAIVANNGLVIICAVHQRRS